MQRKPRSMKEALAPSPKEEEPTKRKKKAAAPVNDAERFLELLKGLNPKDENAFGFFGRDGLDTPINEFISTGSLAIDKLIGGPTGGWPIGRLSECASWEGVGKSTLLDQSIAQVQRMGGIAAVIDSEHSRDASYTRRLGVDTDTLIAKPVETVEDVFSATDTVLSVQERLTAEYAKRKQKPPPLLLVWDSLGATPTKRELLGEPDDKHVAEAAKVIKMNFRRICARIADLRIAFVFVNHFYTDIGPFATMKTSGGSGVRYFTSLRLWLTNKGQIKIGNTVFGHEVEAKTKKTRVRSPRPPAQAGLIYGAGFDNAYTLYSWGKTAGLSSDHKWIVETPQWQYLMLPDGTHIAFQQRFIGLGKAFAERPDAYAMMADHFMRDGEDILGEPEEDDEEEENEDDAEEKTT